MHIRLEGLDTGGNAQEEAGEETVVDSGEASTLDFRGREPTVVDRMGDNGNHPERERGVLGYWDS